MIDFYTLFLNLFQIRRLKFNVSNCILRNWEIWVTIDYFISGKNFGFEIFGEKYGQEELEKRIKDEHMVRCLHKYFLRLNVLSLKHVLKPFVISLAIL